MSFAQHVTEDRRLSLLLLLAESPAYEANEHLLRSALEASFGHAATLDQVNTDLAWLHEQGLVESREIAGVRIARATDRGLDAAAGRAIVPGVKRPSP
jgi:hypothetical protein